MQTEVCFSMALNIAPQCLRISDCKQAIDTGWKPKFSQELLKEHIHKTVMCLSVLQEGAPIAGNLITTELNRMCQIPSNLPPFWRGLDYRVFPTIGAIDVKSLRNLFIAIFGRDGA